jgi:hypothetical protein
MRQKAELAKIMGKKRSVQLRGGLKGGKTQRIFCRSVYKLQKKVPIFSI